MSVLVSYSTYFLNNLVNWLILTLFNAAIASNNATLQPPTAAFITISNPFLPLEVVLEARFSSDLDGTIATYIWSVSDGQIAFGQQSSLKFDQAGVYTITLMVIDNTGLTDIMRRTVKVGADEMNCRSSYATYDFESGEFNIPFIDSPLFANRFVREAVILQQKTARDFRFKIKTDSPKLLEITNESNPCHASYHEIDQTIYIPFIEVTLPETREQSIYQATLQQLEDQRNIFALKTLVNLSHEHEIIHFNPIATSP